MLNLLLPSQLSILLLIIYVNVVFLTTHIRLDFHQSVEQQQIVPSCLHNFSFIEHHDDGILTSLYNEDTFMLK